MGKKILLGCYEVPGYGGASTASYKLFELMQKDGLDVHFLNVIDEQDADYFGYAFGENLGNPKLLDNVHNCVLNSPLFTPHPELDALLSDLSPDTLLGIGYIAAYLLKQAAPKKRLIFLTAGCEQAKKCIATKSDALSVSKYIRGAKGPPVVFHKLEKETVALSDLVITHSDMIGFFYQYFFPNQSGQIYPDVIWFAEWIYKEALDYSGLQKPFHERDIDVIFVASSWSRPEKNYNFVKKIASQCKDLNIHVVGETEKKLPHAEYHGLVTGREELFALMGRSKAIICPSLFDAAPGILFEASAMGCNIIASKNCGNWQICNEALLVDPFNLNNFLEKISLSLSKKYEDNIDYFMKTKSYKNLIETISVF
jgi:glycosyltransferase involved in cell wall biosynthesis